MGRPPRAGGLGTAARPPVPSPPRSPPRPAGNGGAGPLAPRGPGDVPPEGTAMPGGGGHNCTRTPRAPALPTACSRAGRDRRANPEQRTRTTPGPRPGAARDNDPEQYGGRAPHDPSVANDARIVARPGRAEGRTEAERPPGPPAPRPPFRGGGSQDTPPPPPPQAGPPAAGRTRRPGLPHGPDRTRTPGGEAPATKGGLGRGPQAAPPRGGRWGATAGPPPLSPRPPTDPQAAGAPAPQPPRGGRIDLPSPRQDRGAREGGQSRARLQAPAACSRRYRDGQANPRQHTRAPHGPRPETASEHEPERYGGHALHGQSDAKDTSFVACPGKAEGRTQARRPPAPLAPPATQSRRTAHRPPPPPAPPPGAGTPRTSRPTQRGAYSPNPGRGETGRAAHPPNKPNGAREPGEGHADGHGPRGTALLAPSTRTARSARATPSRVVGGGADAAGARAHTHTKDTRGLPEGQQERARGTQRRHGMAYQRARIRDTRTGQPATHSAGNAGREGGNGEDTTPGTGPTLPNRPRAPHTHGQGTAPAKAVVAHRATHQPQG